MECPYAKCLYTECHYGGAVFMDTTSFASLKRYH
jgi:hypothetical protein